MENVNPAKQNYPRGYLLIIIAVLFWGGSASLAKIFFSGNFDTLVLTQTRVTFSLVIMAFYFLLKERAVFRIQKKDILLFVMTGVLGLAVTNYSYYYTVKYSTVATAILIQYTAPVIVMVYMVLVSKEEGWNRIKIFALLLSLIGCYCAVSGDGFATFQLQGWTMISGIASALGFALLIVMTKHFSKSYSAKTTLIYLLFFASLFWLFISTPSEIIAKDFSLITWGKFFFFAIISLLIPNFCFTASAKHLDASTAGIVSTLEPVIAVIVAFFALGETLTTIQMLGGVFVVAAVLLLEIKKQ